MEVAQLQLLCEDVKLSIPIGVGDMAVTYHNWLFTIDFFYYFGSFWPVQPNHIPLENQPWKKINSAEHLGQRA